MRLTLATVALVSSLGISGLTEALWTYLDSLWPSSSVFVAGVEKEGATADPNGATGTPPAGATADPDGLIPTADEGGGADPNG